MAIDGIFGCMLIGVLTASALWGLTAIQTWYYYTHYPLDPWTIKLLVFVVLLSDTIHQALISHMIYTYLITNFGSFSALQNIVWSLIIEVYFNAFTSLLVQCFMVWRIFKLSNKNWFMAVSSMVWVVVELALSIVYCVKGIRIRTFEKLPAIKGISMSINGVTAAGDLYIALFLCYLLHKSRTGFKRSDSMISKLIVFSINTGLLTSICALCSLVTYAAFPHAMIYISFYYNIGRLYCNSLLATLNARKEIRGDYRDEEDGVSFSVQSSGAHKLSTSAIGKRRPANSISIKIDTTKEYVRDAYPMSGSGDAKDAGPEAESD